MTRPETLALVTRKEDVVPGDVGGVIAERRFAGAQTYYHINLAEGEVIVLAPARAAKVGDTVHVRLADPSRAVVFPEDEA